MKIAAIITVGIVIIFFIMMMLNSLFENYKSFKEFLIEIGGIIIGCAIVFWVLFCILYLFG